MQNSVPERNSKAIPKYKVISSFPDDWVADFLLCEWGVLSWKKKYGRLLIRCEKNVSGDT